MAKRIQRKRTKGWRLPANAVYVGRPTQWGNPYSVTLAGRTAAVERYRSLLAEHPGAKAWTMSLRGKDLACWCPLDQPCHADVLLELANGS